MRRKGIVLIVGLLLCMLACAAQSEEYWMPKRSREAFRILVDHLLQAWEQPEPDDGEQIRRDLEVLRGIRESDYAIALSVAAHWEKVYLRPYDLILAGKEGAVEQLWQAGVRNSRRHAFVVLGYALRAGEMTDELKGRCRAAAAAAQAFPETILVCSGGATGGNNPKKHTEAGMMREYLITQFGIAPERIYIDEQAMTTAENAVYTFRIPAIYGQEYGYCPEIVGNFCYETTGKRGQGEARSAAAQVKSMLGLNRK